MTNTACFASDEFYVALFAVNATMTKRIRGKWIYALYGSTF